MRTRRNLPSYPPEEHATPDCDCAGKTCARCGVVKCLGFFHRRGLFGYKSKCKLCKSEEAKTEEARKRKKEAYWRNVEIERARNQEYYRKNAEQRRGYAREYRQNHLEEKRAYDREYDRSERGKETEKRRYQKHRDKRLAIGKKWREANPERRRLNDRAWREANPERHQLNVQAWREANPERARLHAQTRSANRRAREGQVGGKYTTKEWESLKESYDYTCLCCGRREPEIILEPDHVVPLAKGGINTIDNIQPLCMSCNRRKHTKTVDYRI